MNSETLKQKENHLKSNSIFRRFKNATRKRKLKPKKTTHSVIYCVFSCEQLFNSQNQLPWIALHLTKYLRYDHTHMNQNAHEMNATNCSCSIFFSLFLLVIAQLSPCPLQPFCVCFPRTSKGFYAKGKRNVAACICIDYDFFVIRKWFLRW